MVLATRYPLPTLIFFFLSLCRWFFLTWPHKGKGAKIRNFQLHDAEKMPVPLFLLHADHSKGQAG